MKKLLRTMFLLLTSLLLPLTAFASAPAVIQPGIFIMGTDYSGKTKTEAMTAIDSYFQKIDGLTFTLDYPDGSHEACLLSDWDFQWNAAKTAVQAYNIGNKGSLINRYKDRVNLSYGGLYLEVPFLLSESLISESLTTFAETHDQPAVNAKFAHEGSSFVVASDASNGTVTNIEATSNNILHSIADYVETGDNSKLRATVVTQVDYPTVTASDVTTIKDLLGTFTTDYSGSSYNRKVNVETAAGYLNGTILRPGESLSTSTAIMPREEEYGYMIAAQYSNGEAEQDVGGGVCQVSTTLYNAVIRAELQIDMRYNHSMIVHYVEYGDDAAIATGQKDLVFTNTLDYPIYIEGIADGDYLTFNIYGTETRPANRRIEFVAETIYEKWPGTDEYNEKYSSEYSSGSIHIQGTRRPEVSATLTKVVYEDDVEVSRELLHTDYYAASKLNRVHGTG